MDEAGRRLYVSHGTEVVVKARKPGVVEQVNEDLEILHLLAAGAGESSV